jgi:hypothetical protein
MIFKSIATCVILASLTIHPTYSFAETVNLAANNTTTVTASNVYKNHIPENVIDSDEETSWNSGIHPFQWIDINLGSEKEVSEITALVAQSPSGDTTHNIFLDGVLSHTWEGETENKQNLTWTLPEATIVQNIRIETDSSPSWVAWAEISVMGNGTADPGKPNPGGDKKNAAILTEGLDMTIPVIEYKIEEGAQLFYSANFEYLGENAEGNFLWKLIAATELEDIDLKTVSSHLSETPSHFFMQVESALLGDNDYWADFEFIGDNGEAGAFVWKLKDFGFN